MNIIREKNTKIVYFAGNDLRLTSNGLKSDTFYASNITQDLYELLAVNYLPNCYCGGWYIYDNGTWLLTPYGLDQLAKKTEDIRTERLKELSKYNTNWIAERYPLPIQISLLSFFADPDQTEIKKNDVKKVWNWVYKEILPYYYAKKKEIEDAMTIETIQSITWDYDGFDSTDPKIKLENMQEV